MQADPEETTAAEEPSVAEAAAAETAGEETVVLDDPEAEDAAESGEIVEAAAESDDAVASVSDENAAPHEPVQEELLDTGALQRNVEAVLFVASEAMSIKALAKLTGAEESEVTVALQRIDTDFAERGLVLREVAGGYRFASSPAARAVVEAYLLPPKTNLSPAALETLAIVAYNEPVTKAQVEEIRGVSADSVIATLLDRRFIAESGRRESPGRPMLYKTTTEFLEAFGLNSLGDLPAVDLDAMQSREVELPMTQTLSETELATDTEPEAAASEALVTEDAVTEDGATDDATAQATAADESAPSPPDQEAEELSLA